MNDSSSALNKAVAYHKNKIAKLRKQRKRARRRNIIGLSWFERRTEETIKERERLIKVLKGDITYGKE